MARPDLDSLRRRLVDVASRGAGFVDLVSEVSHVLATAVAFDRSCWHSVDPGTVLFTGSVNYNVSCSGRWLATYEYEVDDVNQWWALARTGRLVGRTSAATSGDLSRSARYRSTAPHGIGDELRVSLVDDGVYWGAVGLLRNDDEPWFTEEDEDLLRGVLDVLTTGCRRSLVSAAPATDPGTGDHGPGVIVLDPAGRPETVTPAAERWVQQMMEEPPPISAGASKVVQSIAALARSRGSGGDPLAAPSRARVRTADGGWLTVYAATLTGAPAGRTVVVIQPSTPGEVAPVLALAFGLTRRERDVTQLCLRGLSTKEISRALRVTPYTVQDHLKSIFDKTGARSRADLVGRVFLSHYATRWGPGTDMGPGWTAWLAPHVDGHHEPVW